MKIEATKFFWNGELGFELILQTRTLDTHSRMQQLTSEHLDEIKYMLSKVIEDVIFEFVATNTKPPTA